MRQIGVVAQLIGGRVREQDVKALALPELEAQPVHAPLHLVLGVHVRPLTIAHAAAQPQNAQAVVRVNGVLDADAALRRFFCIAAVVIAVHIEDGRGGEAGEEGQVFRGQIAAGEHKLHAFELAPVQMLPERGLGLIGQ